MQFSGCAREPLRPADKMPYAGIFGQQQVGCVGRVEGHLPDLVERHPCKPDLFLRIFGLFSRREAAGLRQLTAGQLDVIIQADLMARFFVPREEDFRCPAEASDLDVCAGFLFELADQRLLVCLAQCSMTAREGISIVVGRFLQKDLSVPDADACHTIAENKIICFEKDVFHSSLPCRFPCGFLKPHRLIFPRMHSV